MGNSVVAGSGVAVASCGDIFLFGIISLYLNIDFFYFHRYLTL